MKNYKIELIETDENFQIINILLLENGIAAPSDLAELEMPANIDYSKGVIINGRAPIWFYAVIIHECHPAAWAAVYSPRDGGAIVVQSHREDAPKVSEIIPSNTILHYLNKFELEKKAKVHKINKQKTIAFVGPPHSGKSVLINLLSAELLKTMKSEEYHKNFYILRACPDGEGNWSAESEQEIVKAVRYKNYFDDDFIESVSKHIENLKQEKEIIFIDCGGIIDKKNQMIFNLCTDAIIVSRDETENPEWKGACKSAELKVLAEINTKLETISEVITETPLKITLGKLDRENTRLPEIPKILIDKILEK